jgi:NitT/TauT family transport system substrate-binding protein
MGRPAAAADVVKVGVLKIPQTAFVALERGYFAAEGIDMQPVFFQSGAELVPSLATGQIDVAATSAGAALFNAIAQGSHITIVGDHWVSAPTSPSGDSQFITVRKDLLASGTVKSARDVKGMTIAVTARGQVTDLFMRVFLASGGLTEKDVHIVTLSYPDMLAAFTNKAIDLACAIDPYVTLAENDGAAQRFVSESSLLPGVIQAVTIYGDRLGKNDRPLGMRFMRAMTRANTYVRQRLHRNRADLSEIRSAHERRDLREDRLGNRAREPRGRCRRQIRIALGRGSVHSSRSDREAARYHNGRRQFVRRRRRPRELSAALVVDLVFDAVEDGLEIPHVVRNILELPLAQRRKIDAALVRECFRVAAHRRSKE